jgi:hypothetical protein
MACATIVRSADRGTEERVARRDITMTDQKPGADRDDSRGEAAHQAACAAVKSQSLAADWHSPNAVA